MSLEDLFYIKEALTVNRETFRVPKIRTMQKNSISQAELLALTEQNLSDYGKVSRDPRIIPKRRWLREYCIDELPQLALILNGKMRLVGVRPKSETDWTSFSQSHVDHVLKFKPGFLGVQYAVDPKTILNSENPRRTLGAIERLYTREKSKNPIQTDIRYGFAVLRNAIKKISRGEPISS